MTGNLAEAVKRLEAAALAVETTAPDGHPIVGFWHVADAQAIRTVLSALPPVEGEVEAGDIEWLEAQRHGKIIVGTPEQFELYTAHNRRIDRILSRLTSSEWRTDMENAPRDGGQFLALLSNGWYGLYRIVDGPYPRWHGYPQEVFVEPKDYGENLHLTHWMPLPKAPVPTGGGG